MCFSAPASFVAAGGLTALGGASIVIAKKENKILALIPILFAFQQAFEGVQWIYLKLGSTSLFAGYAYVFFAFIVWPVYVPLFVFIVDKKKRRILKWFLFLGIATALYFAILFLTQSLAIHQIKSCIAYSFTFPFRNIANGGYLIAVFGPLFISSRENFKFFGVAIAALAIIAWIFFTTTFVSVWCFFAAIVSSLFFVYLKKGRVLPK